jgi:hypothetical protein
LARKAVYDLSNVFFVHIMMYVGMRGVLMDIYGETVSEEAGDVKDYCDEVIERILELANKMIALANEGDSKRQDVGCGVLFGTLRDSAYKLKSLAEVEIAEHKRQGKWSGVHSA